MRNKVDKKKVITLVVILIVIAAIFLLTKPKNCGSDDSCFNSAVGRCSKAKVNTLSDDNKYIYEILGKKGNNCIIEVTLLKLSESQPYDLKKALEGKSMKCAISTEMLQNQTIKQITNLNDYCTGPLKESILQITLDEMYDIIVKNIGPLTSNFKNRLTIS